MGQRSVLKHARRGRQCGWALAEASARLRLLDAVCGPFRVAELAAAWAEDGAPRPHAGLEVAA